MSNRERELSELVRQLKSDYADLYRQYQLSTRTTAALLKENVELKREVVRMECLVDSIELELALSLESQRIAAARMQAKTVPLYVMYLSERK